MPQGFLSRIGTHLSCPASKSGPVSGLIGISSTSVSGGGLTTGTTRDYEVTLKAGEEYVYSCPLNPTLDYRIVVN